MALAWAARVVHAPVSSMPIQGAARKRALEVSCPAVLQAGAEAAAEGVVDQDYGLGRRGAGLRTAHHQQIDAEPADRLGVEAAGDGVGEAGAVEVDLQSGGFGRRDQGGEIGLGIDRAELGGLRQRKGGGRLPVRLVRLREFGGEGGAVDTSRCPRQNYDSQAGAEPAGRAGLVRGDMR